MRTTMAITTPMYWLWDQRQQPYLQQRCKTSCSVFMAVQKVTPAQKMTMTMTITMISTPTNTDTPNRTNTTMTNTNSDAYINLQQGKHHQNRQLYYQQHRHQNQHQRQHRRRCHRPSSIYDANSVITASKKKKTQSQWIIFHSTWKTPRSLFLFFFFFINLHVNFCHTAKKTSLGYWIGRIPESRQSVRKRT